MAEEARLTERGVAMTLLPCRSWYCPGDTIEVLLMALGAPFPRHLAAA
jgi:hypothetical protein